MGILRQAGSRIAAALSGIATKGEVAKIIDKLDYAAAEARIMASQAKGGPDLSGRSNAFNPALSAPYGRQQRFRSHGNRRFHAKRGGAAQYGTVAHDMANSKAWQMMSNPLLQKLLFVKGAEHMNATHGGK